VQLEEEATGVAEHGTEFIAPPERRCGRTTVLADGLDRRMMVVSYCGHGERTLRGMEEIGKNDEYNMKMTNERRKTADNKEY
jgi:hypothetical protein